MGILDLTSAFKDPSVEWHRVGRATEAPAWFSDEIRRVKWGLYAWTLSNGHDVSLCDRNVKGRRLCGRVLCQPRRHMLKYGKCEGGILSRHRENHDHVHRCEGTARCRRPPRVDSALLRDSLQYFFVLDLTDLKPRWSTERDSFEAAEDHWNRAIQAHLEKTKCVDVQDRRGESRHLVHLPERDELLAVLEELEMAIRTKWR
jgi:hypothetical protein